MISRKKLANAIRILSIDAIQKANSGHPGAVMGMADIATVLWKDYLNHNPSNPAWPNRDRFVLSNGHASMLLYSLLHLTGYNLSIEEIKNFRKLNSKTPGHPEYGKTEGIEVTTGPLGQGIANAVGLAIGERTLSAQFNRSNHKIIDHYTYVFLGDGCMMEGISHEACSFAGTMKLGKLIAFYDKNGISIDGKVEEWFDEDVAKRFESYGWHVISEIDGHNDIQISEAIKEAKSMKEKPSLLICKTVIAFGSPDKSGSSSSHGAPLGKTEVMNTRKHLNWRLPPFVIPEEIYDSWDSKEDGEKKEKVWRQNIENYKKKYPNLLKEFYRRINKKMPEKWNKKIHKIVKETQAESKNISGRKASQNILEKIGPILPELLGGSADLSPSTLTTWSKSVSIKNRLDGNYIHYGVREFGMTAIGNGIANYGGFIPYTSTFLTFFEYAKNAVRLASMMKARHIMIYTHDSIGIGEDGPTHQPIEQLSSIRMIPNMSHWRPCDQVETAVAWKKAIERKNGPTAIILSRQDLIKQNRTKEQIENISRGGYILKECSEEPEIILISSGSEVELAVSIYHDLIREGIQTRVVSIPSTDTFDNQDRKYKESVLPKEITSRLCIEASFPDFWYKYVGLNGKIIGIKNFGESAPSEDLFDFFGFERKKILERIKKFLKKR